MVNRSADSIFAFEMAGLYIHIPFCASRCIYCAFHSTTRNALHAAYAEAVCREMEIRSDFFRGDSVRTVYFGGGTPSQMEPELLRSIILKADRTFGLSGVGEMTLECNPDDINAGYLAALQSTPVNRISMGVQSFHNSRLEFLNRRHTAEEAVAAVRQCQEAGFRNISIDLIYGQPGQSTDEFRDDLATAVSIGVTHISAYCLSYEEGTPLLKILQEGKIEATSDEVCAEMYETLCNAMKAAGFRHYEISNFALPGYRSRHNSSYWNGTRYLGIGSGAHSYDGRIRRWNVADLDRYISSTLAGTPETEQEELSVTDRYNEMVMLSLRTGEGLALEQMDGIFGAGSADAFLTAAGPWLEKGDLIREGGTVHFSESGLFTCDAVISSLFRE